MLAFWKRRRQEQDLDAEIEAHLAIERRDRQERGEPIADARREFGNTTLIKEVTREVWGWGSLERLWQDLRLGMRSFLKSPAFTMTAILSLGLGVGANTTIFTVVSSLFLNPLPLDNLSELASIHTVDASGRNLLQVSHLNAKDLRARNESFADVAAFTSPQAFGLARSPNATLERFFAELVSANYFDVLGLRPARGRFFLPEEDNMSGTHPVIVLAYGAWQTKLGGAEDIVGQTLRINNVAFTVIGIGPEGFRGVNGIFGPDVWIPSMMAEQVMPMQRRNMLRDRSEFAFRLAGRLKPGVTLAQAETNVRAVGSALEHEFPSENRQKSFTARPITEAVFSSTGPEMLAGIVLMAIAGLVLLIACSNVANLLMARSANRSHEMSVRAALGAGRLRLIRQLLTESVLLAVMSGVCGIAIAAAALPLLASMRPPEFARNLIEPKLDPAVFLFALAISAVTGLIFGIAPALESSRSRALDALREARTIGGKHRAIFRGALLAGQVAFSFLALITAGLCLRSIERAYAFDPGFETKRMGLIMLDPGQAGYAKPRVEQYLRDARARAEQAQGVTGAAFASNLPLFTRGANDVRIEGEEQMTRTGGVSMLLNRVEPGYFRTLGVALLRGRDFTEADREGSLPVAIVNEAMANQYWPGREALGRRVQLAGENFYRQVVGVVKNANYVSLGEGPRPCLHVPLAQNFSSSVVLYVRTEGNPTQPLSIVQQELRRMDSQVAVEDVRTGSKIIDQALFGARIGVGLLSIFGLLALALASIGLYGITMYSVNQRQREIGLRMALGAGQGTVLMLVLRQTMRVVAIGLAIGLVISLFTARALQGLLFGIGSFDPLSLVATAAILIGVALAACYWPAWCASRIDPMHALREA